MSNELSKRLHIQPSLAVNQDGDKNVNINNQDGGTVNFNITYQPNNADKSIELTEILQTLSRESYQLFVTQDDEVFKNNVVSVSASRIPAKYSIIKDDCRRYIQISEDDIEELKRIPAIICLENTSYNGFTDPNQWAMFAYIKKTHMPTSWAPPHHKSRLFRALHSRNRPHNSHPGTYALCAHMWKVVRYPVICASKLAHMLIYRQRFYSKFCV